MCWIKLLALSAIIHCAFATHAESPRVVQGVRTPIASLDPFNVLGIDTFQATGNVIEPLAIRDPVSQKLEPWLATSWTLDAKAKTITLKIRENVKFHNGRTLSAQDVQFTFEAFYKPDYKAEIWRAMFEDVESVKVLDPQTVVFKMKKWNYLTFENLMITMRIVPKSFYEPADIPKFQKEIVGTGPFKFKRFDPNRSLDLQANPEWWNGKIDFDLTIKLVNSPKLADEMIAKKQLDFYALSGEHESPNLKRVKAGLGSGFWVDTNQAHPILGKEKNRKALMLAWKREGLNEKVFKNRMKLGLDIYSPAVDFYPAGQPIKLDIPLARRTLRDAGWSDKDQDGILEDKFKNKFSFILLVRSDEEVRVATLFQSDMREIGVDVKIERVEDDSQLYKRLKDGRFDAIIEHGGLSAVPHSSAWHSKGYYNFNKFANHRIDDLLEHLDKEFDPEKRRLILRKIVPIIRERMPQLPGLYSENELFVTSEKIELDSKNPRAPKNWKLR